MSVQTKKMYSLGWNPNPPLTIGQYATFAIATGLSIVLAWLGVIAAPWAAVGISAFYIAVAFMVPFALWFGGWGLIAAYIGCVVGAGLLSGMPLVTALFYSVVDIIHPLFFLVAYRIFAERYGVSPLGRLEKSKEMWFWVIVTLLSNVVAAIWGTASLYLIGFVPMNAFAIATIGWFIGDTIVLLVIGTVVLKVATPIVERLGITVYGLWS
jgi:hypothetical protein